MNTGQDNTSVAWGKTSWLALIAALAQFAAALVIYLFADDSQKVAAGAPLLTAASTLYALVKGRMDQASAKALPAPVVAPAPTLVLNSSQAASDAVDHEEETVTNETPGTAPDDLDDEALPTDDPPPEAAQLPSSDPAEIPADEGDSGSDEVPS